MGISSVVYLKKEFNYVLTYVLVHNILVCIMPYLHCPSSRYKRKVNLKQIQTLPFTRMILMFIITYRYQMEGLFKSQKQFQTSVCPGKESGADGSSPE